MGWQRQNDIGVIRDVVLLKITKRVSYEAGFYEEFLGVAIVPINLFELSIYLNGPNFLIYYIYLQKYPYEQNKNKHVFLFIFFPFLSHFFEASTSSPN